METKTFYAVAEVVQAVAHQHGLVGPVEFTVSCTRDYDWCGVEDDLDGDQFAEVTEEEFADVAV
jgi:hypothetical protein